MEGQGAQVTLGGDQRVEAEDLFGTDGNTTKVWSPCQESRDLFLPFLWL